MKEKVYATRMDTDRQRPLLVRFLEENSKLNLSALRTEDACWHGNILDSLALLELIEPKGPLPVPQSLLDVGTGGGFPLLPLAVHFPHMRCTGLDSTKKKIDAVGRIAKDLHLKNVTLIAERAETAAWKPTYRDSFDMVVSRAVAALPVLLEYAAPFAKCGGHIVLWKSLQIDDELTASGAAQEALCCPLLSSHIYDLGGEWGKRQLLVFRKIAPTPKKFPRAVGVPGKEPISEY